MSWLREVIRDTGELFGGSKGRDLADQYDGDIIGAAKNYLGLSPPPPEPVEPPPPPSVWGYIAAAGASAAVVVAAVAVLNKKR
jgi:hypothetical protein